MVKNPPANEGNVGLVPGSASSPEVRAGSLLLYSFFFSAPLFLPGNSHGQRRLAVYSPWGCKESDTIESQSTHACKEKYS